jgi:hypothetical protein
MSSVRMIEKVKSRRNRECWVCDGKIKKGDEYR